MSQVYIAMVNVVSRIMCIKLKMLLHVPGSIFVSAQHCDLVMVCINSTLPLKCCKVSFHLSHLNAWNNIAQVAFFIL